MRKPWLQSLAYYLKCSPFFQRSAVLKEVDGDQGDVDPEVERRKPGGWKCMPYIIGNETFERVATFGLTANFTVYLVNRFHMKQVVAANVANIFFGTTNFAPLLGAFVSDAYWGRFRTLAYASVATFLGMVVLTLTATVPQLRPPHCDPVAQQAGSCASPSRAQLGMLLVSLFLLIVGAGGIRPCSLPFGVDQFDLSTEQGHRSLNKFFNWYYCTSTAGIMAAMTVVVYIQNSVSWSVGFGIPTGLMLIAIILFFLGTRLYVYVPPEGSVFSGIVQVFVAAYRKRNLRLPATDDAAEHERQLYHPGPGSLRVLKLPLTLQFRFLNKAAIICEGELKEDGTPTSSWRLCSTQQIEEVKCLLRIVPIWAAGIICFVAMAQQWTFTVLQALTMDRHIGPHFQIPPGSVAVISLLALSLFVPVYDQVFVPMARRATGIQSGITLLQRQGVGMVISTLSMVVAGLVEEKRRSSALSHGGAANGHTPMSALWLAPQLVLMGLAEAFNAIGQIEFYNRQFPEHMQTLAGSLFFCSLAGASYLSSLLVAVVQSNTGWLNNNINMGRVDYFYFLIAGLGAGNLLYFLVCAHFYRYKGTAEVKEGFQGSVAVI